MLLAQLANRVDELDRLATFVAGKIPFTLPTGSSASGTLPVRTLLGPWLTDLTATISDERSFALGCDELQLTLARRDPETRLACFDVHDVDSRYFVFSSLDLTEFVACVVLTRKEHEQVVRIAYAEHCEHHDEEDRAARRWHGILGLHPSDEEIDAAVFLLSHRMTWRAIAYPLHRAYPDRINIMDVYNLVAEADIELAATPSWRRVSATESVVASVRERLSLAGESTRPHPKN